MNTIQFSKCTLSLLEDLLGVYPIFQSDKLDEWLNTSLQLPELEKNMLERLVTLLEQNAFHWSEYDLALHFIGPLFSLINFTAVGRFNLFAQIKIEAEVVPGITLMGRVEEIIATGYRTPKVPFFVFTEYKKDTDPKGDPLGQCLSAMIVGQKLNEDPNPIYGCVVNGRNWRFLLLDHKSYIVSNDYSATDFQQAYRIAVILQQLKQYCLDRTAHLILPY
ncbi:MAG: hypothetical protein JNM36_05655 [Chitinophagales bacterium]|nr:hypothetical protein [Chitinophagales bacterium]HNL08359.1 hypothetical protein [Chitinophagales bacterium]